MRRFAFGLLFGVAAYAVAAIAGYFLVQQFSSNVHDPSVEASMTSVFFFGPIGGAAGFVAGLIRGSRPPELTRATLTSAGILAGPRREPARGARTVRT